jgi:hypothetical protein
VSEGHGAAHGHHEGLEDAEITKSAGIAPSMILFLALSLIVICMQAGFVIGASPYWKAWPAADAVKAPLPDYKP